MTKDEALKLSMEAMEITGGFDVEINAIKQALAQPEQEPVKFEAVWDSGPTNKDYEDAMRLKRLQQLTAPPQRKPLTDEEIWVLTSEYNDYDQHGEYFEAIFIGKPTSKQIQKHCHVTEQGAVHILNGGGRVKYEDQWYNLRKEKTAHGIKGLA